MKRKIAAWQRMPFWKRALLKPIRPSFRRNDCGYFISIDGKLYEARDGRDLRAAKSTAEDIRGRLSAKDLVRSVRTEHVCCRAGEDYIGGKDRKRCTWDGR